MTFYLYPMENKKNIPVPVFFAAIWILIKLALFTFKIPNQEKIGVYANLLLVLLTVFASLNQKIRLEKKLETYATNFKHCLKNAGIYIIIVTAYIFIHYKYVNPDYLKNKELNAIEMEMAKDFEVIKANTPTIQNVTKAEYEEKVREAAQTLSSISLNTSFYFLGLFMMGIFTSIFIPIIYKKLVLRM